jgi:hypothetical protein
MVKHMAAAVSVLLLVRVRGVVKGWRLLQRLVTGHVQAGMVRAAR